jgi:hypothetical protein
MVEAEGHQAMGCSPTTCESIDAGRLNRIGSSPVTPSAPFNTRSTATPAGVLWEVTRRMIRTCRALPIGRTPDALLQTLVASQ